MYETRPRYGGVLFPLASLPGPCGIGDLGTPLRQFAAFLETCRVTHWQILPLGPTGYGNSPYAARSAFAGSEILIDPEDLAQRGFIGKKELVSLASRFTAADAERVNYEKVLAYKLPLLKKAAAAFLSDAGKHDAVFSCEQFEIFCEREAYWLSDYALFQVLYESYNDARWHTVWDAALARRDQGALKKIRAQKQDEIRVWYALQYFFDCQWKAAKEAINARGIKLIGDIPIFVAPDSADSWSRPDLLWMDQGGYTFVSGVPPDYFSRTGQLWGNPVFAWEAHKKEQYRWWKNRIKRLMDHVDLFRIDHFRGFDEYWAVPAACKTAEAGEWKKGPGADFFESLKAELGPLPVVAEDLGFMTESVKKLRDDQGFPGMKVCQFGFEDMKKGILDARHLFLPHNYGYNWAAYTGTHDNDTSAGWFDSLEEADQKTVAAYFNVNWTSSPLGAKIASAMVRAVLASRAAYAIIPLQDILGLGAAARINIPSTCTEKNWSWRLPSTPSAGVAKKFAKLLLLYSRARIF
ncbi:MAG: 4-alpha-glucanotransferase [Treponema sp.]|jgi:4-alpha-glucanotransferase|nr:4-alpha-glucanotransferase [Treponema sp.]